MAVYPATLLHIDLFSEETNGLTTVSVVLNICIYGCMYTSDLCMHRQSFARSTNTLIREHLVLPARRSRTRNALCRYAYVRKNLITVVASFLIEQKRRHDVLLFFLLPPSSVSYASQKISQSLEIKGNIACNRKLRKDS